MTATTTTIHDTAQRSLQLAVGGAVASAVASAVGSFADLTGNEAADNQDVNDYLFTVGVIVVLAGLLFALVVRGAAEGNASRRAAILGVVAALTFVVFWTGAPLVLASASVACALVDRDRLGSFGTGSKIGLVGSALAATSAVVLAIVG